VRRGSRVPLFLPSFGVSPGLEGTSLTGGEPVWRAACPTPAPNGAQTLTVDAVALPSEAHGRTRRHSRYVIVIALVHDLFFARSLMSISHVGYHGRGRRRSWLYHSILSVIIFVIALLMVQ
jgi:hypothetical protein